jgi:hypothetical protein
MRKRARKRGTYLLALRACVLACGGWGLNRYDKVM